MECQLVSFIEYFHPLDTKLLLLSRSVFDYNYILFWNSLWTIAPVIAIGLFDRFLGESGTFGVKPF
jgi:hypothetical protein